MDYSKQNSRLQNFWQNYFSRGGIVATKIDDPNKNISGVGVGFFDEGVFIVYNEKEFLIQISESKRKKRVYELFLVQDDAEEYLDEFKERVPEETKVCSGERTVQGRSLDGICFSLEVNGRLDFLKLKRLLFNPLVNS